MASRPPIKDSGLEVVGDLARRTRVYPPFDCISTGACVFGSEECEASEGRRHGRGSERVYCDLVGPTGAVTLDYFTDTWLASTPAYVRTRGGASAGAITYHYPEQRFDFDPEPRDCDVLPEGRCWSDVGFLNAQTPFLLLKEEGEEAMWRHLATLLPKPS